MPAPPPATISEAELWGRLLELAERELTPEVAKYLLTLRFPAADVERMHALSEKAREGTLTRCERAEMDTYERVGHSLSIIKSKARGTIKRQRRPS